MNENSGTESREREREIQNLSNEELIKELKEKELQIKKLVGGGFMAAKIHNELFEIPPEERDQDEIKDGYQLKFVGKDYAKLQAGLKTETIITPDTAHNSKPENANSENIFITGDNLDALKHLENAYSGKVDVIYIDPPYNTGSDGFVYADNFKFSDDDLKEKLNLTEEEISRVRALNGKSSHPAWLTFMLPRLMVAKRLLSDTGVIFISIDDNEQANLNMLMTEIFGENNFIANMPRKTRSSATTKSDAEIQKLNDYVIMYSKRENIPLKLKIIGQKKYPLTDDRGDFYIVPLQDNGPHGTRAARPNLYYPIYVSLDNSIIDNKPFNNSIKVLPGTHQRQEGCWMWSPKKFDSDKNDLYYKNGKIYIKHYHNPSEDQNKYQREKNWLNENFLNSIGTKRLTELEMQGLFSNPKPVELEIFLINLSANKNAVVLDFFAGSATTADAVMQLNKEDGGNRKYILVQLPEKVSKNSEAEKAGYKTIDQISRERIIRAAAKIGDNSGFKHFRLTTPNDENALSKLEEFDPNAIVAFPEDMTTTFDGGEKAILQTWLIDDGFEFNQTPKIVEFAGYQAHYIEQRLYLISTGWSSEATRELLNAIGKNKLAVQSIVIFPYSFTFNELNELKINLRTAFEKSNKIELLERY